MIGTRAFKETLDPWKAIYEVFAKAPVMDEIEARILLQDAYEIHAKIYDHRKGDRPFSSVEMLPNEDILKYGALSDFLHDYAENAEDYWGCWRLSVAQLLSLPAPYARRLRDIARERREVRLKREAALANQLNVGQ